MILETSPYELVARINGRRRSGALLRVTFDDGVRGYADVHPWPELGDAPLDRQILALTQRRPEPLAARSLALARADGEARAQTRSLFEGLAIPPSHASLPFGFGTEDLARVTVEGYKLAKLKGWEFSAEDIERFRASGLRFRLDFNAKREANDVERLLDRWGDLAWIDWLEDPCPYRPEAWGSLQKRVRLALDFEHAPNDAAFDVRVVKPARDASWFGPRLAFTSYLDHPVGQLGAAWTAACALAEDLPLEPGGLVTHEVYEPTPFSRQLQAQNARLVPPEGPGLGFATELERLEWRTLKA